MVSNYLSAPKPLILREAVRTMRWLPKHYTKETRKLQSAGDSGKLLIHHALR
jgi:hypothetical protein